MKIASKIHKQNLKIFGKTNPKKIFFQIKFFGSISRTANLAMKKNRICPLNSRNFSTTKIKLEEQEYMSKSEIKSHRYNLKINDALSKKKYDEAIKLFEEMPEEDIEQNENSFAYVIAACAAKNDQEGMNKYTELMKSNYFKPTTSTYSIIIRVLAEKGDLEGAEKIFEKMNEAHIELNSSIFNHILKRCAQDNKLPKMRNWFRKMVSP